MGTLLPCNVVVYENDGGDVSVVAVDPTQTLAEGSESLRPIAARVREKLERVLARLEVSARNAALAMSERSR